MISIMENRGLYIMVEGDDDERFFKKLIQPCLEKKYQFIKFVKYASVKNKFIINLIKSIKSDLGTYIFVSDINHIPCVKKKKERLLERIINLKKEKIIVVIKEIESWYLASLDSNSLKLLGLPQLRKTDNIFKEKFNYYFERTKFDSKINLMIEILKYSSIEIAEQKNQSFKYFSDKYGINPYSPS